MVEQPIEERVHFLEHTLNRFIIHTDKSLYRLEKNVEKLSWEMKEFKDEMREFKDEVRADTKAFKDEVRADTKAFKDEVREFKDEMKEFKDEMKEFKEESVISRREMNKKWGDLTNKLGTFAEDIAAPNIPRIAKQYFNAKSIIKYMPNIRAQHPSKPDVEHEFDTVVETDKLVFLLETKFTVRDKYIEKIPQIIQNFQECFPEYAKKELITIFGSMNIHENTVKRLTKMGIYAMAMGDDNMDLLNFDDIQKKHRRASKA